MFSLPEKTSTVSAGAQETRANGRLKNKDSQEKSFLFVFFGRFHDGFHMVFISQVLPSVFFDVINGSSAIIGCYPMFSRWYVVVHLNWRAGDPDFAWLLLPTAKARQGN